MHLFQSRIGPLAQLVQRAELDRVGRARLGARRLRPDPEPVVAERALPGAAVVLPLVDDAVGAGGDAVAAAVADVLLHDHGVELRPEQGSGRTDVETCGVGAVLAY